MGFLDWTTRGKADENGKSESASPEKSASGELPFRFQEPFAHVYSVMSAEERKIVDEIETRWKQRYDLFRNHPAMSEGQQHEMAVFRAIDGVHKALNARENAPFGDWKRLEANAEKAIEYVRRAFDEQRRFVGREMNRSRER
jgi:hypothetical protein